VRALLNPFAPRLHEAAVLLGVFCLEGFKMAFEIPVEGPQERPDPLVESVGQAHTPVVVRTSSGTNWDLLSHTFISREKSRRIIASISVFCRPSLRNPSHRTKVADRHKANSTIGALTRHPIARLVAASATVLLHLLLLHASTFIDVNREKTSWPKIILV
jgi:hypothetical protein